MEIRLAELEALVEIAIRTRHSCYLFQVTEPEACLGFLSGGRLGPKPRDAFLANTFLATNSWVNKQDRLTTGYRAMFYLGGTGPEIITTSVITELAFAATKPNNSSTEDC